MAIVKCKTVPAIFFLLLPFIVLFWYVPIPGWHIIGNDYASADAWQRYLFYSISNGSFPLYIPGFYIGQSSSALTGGQMYHPLSWIAVLIPGYWQGYSLLICTILRYLSLGVAQLLLYCLFLRLSVSPLWAFICSFIAVYNLRMLDCFRYTASLESYTGFLFSCAFLAYIWLERRNYAYLFLLVFSEYWVICSGHTQMAYYGGLGSALFALLCPFFCTAMQGSLPPSRKALIEYYALCLLGIAAALMLSAAYWIPFYMDYMRFNSDRVHQTYGYSIAFGDNVIGEFNSFFFPLRGDVHGNFGGSALIVLALVMPVFCLIIRNYRLLICAIWGISAIIFLFTLGQATPVHHFLWEWMPFADDMRVPGRLALILPFLITLMLMLFRRCLSLGSNVVRQRMFWLIFSLAAFYTLYSFGSYFFWSYRGAMPIQIRHDIPKVIPPFGQWLGIMCLVAMAVWVRQPKKQWLGWLVCLTVVAQTTVFITFGTWVGPVRLTQTKAAMDASVKRNLYFGGFGYGFDSKASNDYTRKLIELGKLHLPHLNLAQYKNPPLATVRSKIDFGDNLDQFFNKLRAHSFTMPVTNDIATSIQLVYSSFNQLLFIVTTSNNAYVVLNYPLTSHWRATVNSRPAPIYRANGLYMAVPVPPGQSILEVRYWSDAQFIGMLISCATLAIILVGISYHIIFRYALNWPLLYITCISGIIIAFGSFLIWKHSLYNGTNLETRYVWKSRLDSANLQQNFVK